MIIVFNDREGVILCHGIPVRKTVNSEYNQKANIILKVFEFSKLSAFMKETLTNLFPFSSAKSTLS